MRPAFATPQPQWAVGTWGSRRHCGQLRGGAQGSRSAARARRRGPSSRIRLPPRGRWGMHPQALHPQ
eukprot:5279214-Alexandrium_andersonii.AAC.1